MARHVSGETIRGRYELKRVVGAGAFGEVWLAHDSRSARPVAIKFLKTNEAWAVQRFDVEAAALARLDHPNCVALLDFGHVDGGAPFLVTEFLTGSTLADWLGAPRSAAQAIDVARQIAAGVAHAHERRVVHRDLKPSNIWLITDPDGSVVVKVLDFGLARLTGSVLSDITKTGEVIGTPGYMSPEQLRAAPDIGAPTDVYSLGVILFRVLEGRPPFVADTMLELALQHLGSPAPVVRASVPPGIAELVAAMLKKNPQERPTLVEVLRQLRGDAVRSLEEATTRRRVSGGERDRKIAIAAVLLGCLGLGAYRLFDRPPEPTRTQVIPASRVIANPLVRGPSEVAVHEQPIAPPLKPIPDAGAELDLSSSGSSGCGTSHRRITADDGVYVRTPDGYDANMPAPVLIVLHDLWQRPAELLQTESLMALADRDGFVVASYASMVPAPLFPWLHRADADNVVSGFRLLARRYCLDLDRVFVLGHGNGAVAADYVACQLPGVVALASSSHRLWGDREICVGMAVVPTILLSPLEDPAAPIDGLNDCFGTDSKWSLSKHEKILRDHHHCREKVKDRPTTAGGVCQTSECDVELVWCRIEGGRDWKSMPDRRRSSGSMQAGYVPGCQSSPGDYDQATAIWEFFRHVEDQRKSGPAR